MKRIDATGLARHGTEHNGARTTPSLREHEGHAERPTRRLHLTGDHETGDHETPPRQRRPLEAAPGAGTSPWPRSAQRADRGHLAPYGAGSQVPFLTNDCRLPSLRSQSTVVPSLEVIARWVAMAPVCFSIIEMCWLSRETSYGESSS